MTATLSREREATRDLPFTLSDLRRAIPADCFRPSTVRSLAYAALDLGIVAGLFYAALAIHQWWFFPIYWFAQGTMFWALFVVGHDCGHGSFSRHRWLNDLVGHLTHSLILVPYHGWRISHRTHHANTGNVETDESWYPITETNYQAMDAAKRAVRFHLQLIAYPIYLFKRSPGRKGSHFNPASPLFKPQERTDILTSTACWLAMVGLLAIAGATWGWGNLVAYYLMPYLGFVIWLDLVTFLHHTEPDIPWYRGEDWYFLKGALSTIDRDYGIFNPIHHHIGTHVAHHIFSNIPHYKLHRATAAIKPILGDLYRESKMPIWQAFFRSSKACWTVPDQGSPVYYGRPERP